MRSQHAKRSVLALLWLLFTGVAAAQVAYRAAPAWPAMPTRPLGSVSDVAVDREDRIWVAERCGANDCSGTASLDPILRLGHEGRWLDSFGAGLFAWPHGLHVDHDGFIWVTDGRAGAGRGHQVHKFASNGRLLMSLGQAGEPGSGPTRFDGPTDVQIASNGDIFVADGHESNANNRIVKFSADGRYLLEWGGPGSEPGRFDVPHALAMDTLGRLFVADRNNNRIQIFDQQGGLIDIWTQFGRPSGIYIDDDDVLYVSDNQSNDTRNAGWVRGIRVGSARDGRVWSFIPDPAFDPDDDQETSAHGVAADSMGNIFGAEVWSQTVIKYVREP